MMIRTYKYRLYPNNAQERALDFLLWQARRLYNSALEFRILYWEQNQERLSYYDQRDYFCALRKQQPDTLGILPYGTVDSMMRRLQRSFDAFFRRLKAGEKPGYPRFKGRHRFHSIEYRPGSGFKFIPSDNRKAVVRIAHVGEIRVKYHRSLPDGVKIKHAIVKRNGVGKWFVCLMLELPDREPAEREYNPIGIDVGLKSLLALSDGTLIDNPRWLRNALAKLRIAERRKSRRKKGSNRRNRARLDVARLHEKVANQRRHIWHVTTHRLIKNYSIVAIEDLPLGFMTRNEHLALSAHDAGLGEFRQLLEYKAESAGTPVIAVNPYNTTQVCSGCGVIVPKGLKDRVHRCVSCGLEIDRDVNAARNILQLALKSPEHGVQGVTQTNGSNVPCEVRKSSAVAIRSSGE